MLRQAFAFAYGFFCCFEVVPFGLVTIQIGKNWLFVSNQVDEGWHFFERQKDGTNLVCYNVSWLRHRAVVSEEIGDESMIAAVAGQVAAYFDANSAPNCCVRVAEADFVVFNGKLFYYQKFTGKFFL